jgi:multicomponent Na+:H+ antiporter subunit D
MLAATGGMVLIGIALTVFAGPLFAFSDTVGAGLESPQHYVELVFPSGGADE